MGTLSNAWVNLGLVLTGDAQRQAYAQARTAADKEMALAPDTAETHLVHGYLLQAEGESDPAALLAEYKRAYALAPNDGTVMGFLAAGYATLGQLPPVAELYRKAVATDHCALPSMPIWLTPFRPRANSMPPSRRSARGWPCSRISRACI